MLTDHFKLDLMLLVFVAENKKLKHLRCRWSNNNKNTAIAVIGIGHLPLIIAVACVLPQLNLSVILLSGNILAVNVVKWSVRESDRLYSATNTVNSPSALDTYNNKKWNKLY